MFFSPKIVTFSTPMVVISGGSYYAYDAYWPKTIGEWFKIEGIPVIIEESKDKETNHLKAMFNDHKEEVGDLSFEGLTSTTSEEDAVPKLKKWCQTNLKKPWTKELRERMYKYCIYKPKKIKGWIIGSGKYLNFITKEEDYKTIFAIFKSSLSNIIETIESNDTPETAKSKIKTWCQKELDKGITSHTGGYSEIFTFCTTPPYKTVREMLDKNESGLTTKITAENNDEKWKKAFETWKLTEKVINFIKKSSSDDNLNSTTDKNEGGPKMKDWCTKGLDKNLYDDDVLPDEYSAIKSACKLSS